MFIKFQEFKIYTSLCQFGHGVSLEWWKVARRKQVRTAKRGLQLSNSILNMKGKRGLSAEISKMDQHTDPKMKYQFKMWNYLKVETTCNVEEGKYRKLPYISLKFQREFMFLLYLVHSDLSNERNWVDCLPKAEQFTKL